MPLSEDEQRILSEIEQQLHETDPELAHQVSKTTLYKHASRSIKWSIVGFLLGFVLLILTVSETLLALVGFGIMLACLFILERNVRKLGKAGFAELTGSSPGSGVRGTVGNVGKRWRERWRRDGD
ncbi:MAG: DUF3040 domain-containing protein [Acidimicrobiia bacterium]|nr:DUF3040 domain-containing protein [Acidimicrobiia bacterium]